MRHETEFKTPTLSPVIKGLVEVRLAWGLERVEVAHRAGILYRNLLNYESGVSEPHMSGLRRWANALGYELSLRPLESKA